jgi:hypothetical protein
MKPWRRRAAAVFAAVLLAGFAAAQTMSRYDMYGPVAEVTIADLASGGVAYTNRAVRTKGWLERDMTVSNDRNTSALWRLRDTGGYTVAIQPVPDILDSFETEAATLLGQRVEVTGLFTEDRAGGLGIDRSAGIINFWKFLTLPDPDQERMDKARKLTIEELATRPERHSGRTVRVVGEFRGHNLFDDLPAKSMRKRSDWVLHHGEHAIWVTGKKPKGDGWELDPAMKRDSGKWIEVTGKVEARDGVMYIKAERLLLAAAPLAVVAKAEATAAPPERPKRPPIVVFSLPLDGEVEVPDDSRFVVQFSKDMDEATFAGRVELRYISAPRAGVRPLTAVSYAYEPGRRALTVDPGDQLGRGTEVELRLLPGIKDVDGLELVPRNGGADDGIVDALRYRVGL